jgi:hypothetical protein
MSHSHVFLPDPTQVAASAPCRCNHPAPSPHHQQNAREVPDARSLVQCPRPMCAALVVPRHRPWHRPPRSPVTQHPLNRYSSPRLCSLPVVGRERCLVRGLPRVARRALRRSARVPCCPDNTRLWQSRMAQSLRHMRITRQISPQIRAQMGHFTRVGPAALWQWRSSASASRYTFPLWGVHTTVILGHLVRGYRFIF